MWPFSTKKSNPEIVQKITLKVSGLHCTSCALTIDDTLENLPGVLKSSTNYAQGKTVIVFDEKATTLEPIQAAIRELGYEC